MLCCFVQLLNHVWFFETLWTAADQDSLFLTISSPFPSSCPLHHFNALHCHPAISSSDNLFSCCLQSFPASGTFQWVIYSHHITKILKLQLQYQSFQWIFRVDLHYDWLAWSPCCSRDFQEPSLAPQFEGINSLVFCLLYDPALTTVCDHWEDDSLDYTDFCWKSKCFYFSAHCINYI